MKTQIQATIIATIFIFSTTLASAGGGWPQPKGKGYFKLSEWWLVSDQHYTDQGLIDPNITTGIFNTSIYAEYGFTDRLTGIVYFPFFSRSFNNNQISATTGETLLEGEAINSIGDTDISLKYGITKPGSKVAISASVLFGLPIGKDSGGTQGNLQTGDGEFNQFARIDASTSFNLSDNVPAYISLYGGVNNRSNDFSDELRLGAEFGLAIFNQKLWLNGKLNIVDSFENGIPSGLSNSTSLFANNAEFTNLTFEAAYNISDSFGVSASYGTALSGKIILASAAYSVGVYTNF